MVKKQHISMLFFLCYGDEENARIYAVHLTTANQRQDVQSASCLCASLLTQSGRGEKQASGKTHGVGEEGAYVRSIYLGCARRYTTERKRCGDTRGREKQAGKPTPEAYR